MSPAIVTSKLTHRSFLTDSVSSASVTPNQLNAFNRILTTHSRQIPNFDSYLAELEMVKPELVEDLESGPLLAAMDPVTTWNEPVKRGKRIFDDQSFHKSLAQQLGRKGSLSDKQRAAA